MTRAPVVVGSSAAIAAIAYAVKADEGLTFLRCWQHGDFDEIRADWPDAPEAVFIGAEAFSPATAGRSDAPPVLIRSRTDAAVGAGYSGAA